MQKKGVDAYIIPNSDPHQSEYPATHWKSLNWISGFTGSAGTVLVANDHAGLWTDSRYFIQGEQELSTSSFELHKMTKQHHPGYIDWCLNNLPKGAKVVIDGPMASLTQRDKYAKALAKKDLTLLTTTDFIDEVWADRPTIPTEMVFEHDITFSGESRKDKIDRVKAEMAELGADTHLITTLDDIAWLMNLRGRDVECNPVFVSYCLIGPQSTLLFIDTNKVSPELTQKLATDKIELRPYSEITSHLTQLKTDKGLLIHKATLNVQLYDAINPGIKVIDDKLISRHLKAIKNTTEIDHIRAVHIKDGLALTEAFYWLEQTLKDRTVTEYEFADKLTECRGRRPDYFGNSFSAIVGYKGNGAIVHYRPDEKTSATIENNGILLVDSGGQYTDGTTDITRTITLSPPPEHQKRAYTRVLQGHIGLAMAIFPEGTVGGQLDTYARQHLWSDGMNYGHGTGHGVGFFLNVHEPPQGIAPGIAGRAASKMKAGMFTSNEPGHYVTDDYGIRIENLVLAIPAKQEGFLQFETITYFPIDTQLIEFGLLTKKEVAWLNDYHQMVKDKLCPHLDGELKAWMEEKCKEV